MEDETPKGFFKDLNLDSFLASNRYVIITSLLGLTLIGAGVFYVRSGGLSSQTKVEVLSGSTEAQNMDFVVEVVGAVEKPGVYTLSGENRVEDALVAAGGLSADADREWVEKTLNRAAKVTDGQKIFIPRVGETAPLRQGFEGQGEVSGVSVNGLININSASLKELDSLPGIGPVYGQNIIDHRPYSAVEELVSKGAIKQSVYEKIKDKISVY